MKLLFIPALLFALSAWSVAEPPGPPPPHCFSAPRAWLGLKIGKPETAVAGLPPGMGFVVLATGKDGPAAAAGIREGDILWKLDGQMLVNESQLAALLRLSKPGDEVGISGFRGSEPLEIKLKLGEAAGNFPARADRSGEPETARAAPRRVKIAGKSATYSADGAIATVSRAGEGYAVTIRGADESVIFDGFLAAGCDSAAVPDDWKRAVHVLCRTLDRALKGGMPDGGQTRPRVVPPARVAP